MATNARVPLCHFFFSHPFRVGDVCHGTLPLRHPRLPAPAPLAWRRGRTRVRRRGVRRYPPSQLLKTHVFLYPPGASLVPRTPPTIEELLWTIRDAWPPPRSFSLDSEQRDKPSAKVPVEVMGTGSKKEQAAPRMGLPYRRYSVPEIVMRKYTLSRAQTSASDVVTAPTPSVPSIGTSSGTVRRMCHKACQTSSPDSGDQPVEIPTVNIIPSTNLNRKEDKVSKHSSNSNEFSPSEEISDYGVCPSRVYKSELSLPGAVVESARFLRVPDLILDPNDSPQVNSEDNGVFENYVDSELRNSPVMRLERDKFTETSNTLDENLSSLLEQSDTQQDKRFLRSKSHSIPELSEVSSRTDKIIGLADVNQHLDQMLVMDELTIEQQLHFEQSLSPEGTPTPAPTCHTYDSQGNMLSECYITDCEVCNAEGRKCCSLDDSGSQSCSFTSPEMISSNELKSSTDFTTSSMTLDQTVSDRTTSTQDSTVSLTSITPESAESKEACSNINISPILVIDSETALVNVLPRSKKKHVSTHLTESSLSEKAKPQSLLDSIPTVISSERCIIEQEKLLVRNHLNSDLEIKQEKNNMSPNPFSVSNHTYSELNNNKVTISKDIYTQSEPLSTIEENEVIQTLQGGAKCQADHYLYLSESESGNTQDTVSTNINNVESNQKLVGNYTKSHLYLTETESTPTEDTKEDDDVSKNKTGAYSTDFLYMTESESPEADKTLSSSDKSDVGVSHTSGGNYASNYMYMSESESSGLSKTADTNYNKHKEKQKRFGGSYSKNYMYMTESESPDTISKTPASDSKELNVEESIVGNITSGAYTTNYLYITESDSSEATRLVNSNLNMETEIIRKNVGSYAKKNMYMTESDSPDTQQTANSETEGTPDAMKDGTQEYAKGSETSEVSKTLSPSSTCLKCSPKVVGNCATDYLYLTETESSDTKKTDSDKNEKLREKNQNVGSYSSNYMYMTESESPTTKTRSSEENKNNEIIKSSNYKTEYLYMTESEKSKETVNSTPEIKEDKAHFPKHGGNFATDYLYLSESDSSQNKVTDFDSKVGVDVSPKTVGNSTTNYLYLTESESSNTSKSLNIGELDNKNKKLGGKYANSNFYMTASESTPTTKCLSPNGEEGLNSYGKNKGGTFATDYLYMSESNSSGITKVSTLENNPDISSKLSGNFEKGHLYLTESESNKTQSSTGEEIKNKKIKMNHKPSRNYGTNYMYMTEDESGFNPDSLEITTPCSRDDFEMDSLAINESTDESNMLENLGFSEDFSILENRSNANNANPMANELMDDKPQDKFCGNTQYEIISKGNDTAKGQFKGNVMPALEEKIPQPSNILTKRKISSPIGKTYQNKSLEDECKILVDNELTSKTVDEETTMGSVAGGTYWEIPGKELVIPRFSALPRTLSMIVNTSSMDCSSDSDLSLADSLEDSKSDDKNKGLKLYNKYDNRLVRGDIIALLPEESEVPKKTSKESQAYFLSITGEEGEIKVKQIPEELKKKLLKRDLEIRKHSDHVSSHGQKCKGKNCSKKNKKHHHHCCSSSADLTSKGSSKTRSLDEFSGTLSKFTQWEDLDSSKDSSDTLVPSDFSEKDKDAIFQGDYKLKDVSTSPPKCEFIDNNQQNDLNCWLETVNSSTTVGEEHDKENNKNSPSKSKLNKKLNNKSKTKEVHRLANKWVQCENMPHVDSVSDEEISRLLIENSTDDNENDELTDGGKFKCANHKVPWSKDMFVQVSEDLLVQDIVDIDLQTNALTESKSVQTAHNINSEVIKDNKESHSNKIKSLLEDTSNKLELNLTGSPRIPSETRGSETQFLNATNNENEERCKTPVLGERPDSKVDFFPKQDKPAQNKPSPKFNVKSTPSRRPGNLGIRFKQKFEVIPEEKSGSFESSNEEKKSPKPARGRRASMPSEMILKDIGHSQNKSSDSSTSSGDKKDGEEGDLRNTHTVCEGGDYPRRHTIHGNLSRSTKSEVTNKDKNEHSRRHTIHGSLSLSKSDAMLKQLNLLGGTLLKGRVFGKQSGVMFGRFRPINEETQVQKDERSLVEEQLGRLRGDASKGREALAVAQTEGGQDDLLTLSKGWINFYLLGDSQDLGSDGSNTEEGSRDSKSEDKKRTTPSLKTVTVVGKSEEDLRQQFTVQINASPEIFPEAGKLPDICEQNHKTYKTPSLSPDLTLPDITPTSSPTSTPPLPETPNSLKPELPQIHPKSVSRHKRNINEKYKPNGKKASEKTEKREKVQIDNDQHLRYMKLSSMKHELQTEKTYFARSGEVACSELSQSSSTSVTADSPTLPSIKWPSRQLQRRHSRHIHTRTAPGNTPPNPQACWTVTLAGSSGNPTQPPPDVEMRLSFSNQQRGPATSQSDSGLGEDGPPERGHRGHHALLPPSKHPPPDTNQWKVLLKTHQETERSTDQIKADKRASLPDFNFTPSTARQKKNSKRGGRWQEDPPRPGSVQVQEILEHNISLHKSSLTEEEWVEGLSVTGQAITPERKPRVPTMSERDLTRQWYHRARLFH